MVFGELSDHGNMRIVTMKQKLLLLVFFLTAITTWADVEINDANFPDANFRNWVLKQTYGADGVLTDTEISGVNLINVSEKNIQSLKGIEYFTMLTTLYCYSNQLSEIDVSKNAALTLLSCFGNQLTSLDVSNNPALTELYCYNNQLTGLNVRSNSTLEILSCGNNHLTELDISNNTKLAWFNCHQNQLSVLDVSNNTALTLLSCKENQLTTLDISKNTMLTELYCWGNQLTTLDVSNNTALTWISCNYNHLMTLDVSKNTKLETLYCHENQLTSLDISNNTALTLLSCSYNNLTSLDLSNNTKLTKLYCYINQLTSLDLSNNTALTELECFDNRIKGMEMYKLVQSLPQANSGKMYICDNLNFEKNEITTSQVATAKSKGWTTYYWNNGDEGRGWTEYEGCEEGPDIEVDGIYYKLIGQEAIVVGKVNKNLNEYVYKGDIVIPESITIEGNTYKVSAIDNEAFAYSDGLVSVKVPNSVTTISDGVFKYCNNLVNVQLSERVQITRFNNIFLGCKKLSSIIIPKGVKTIGNNAFYGCVGLKSVTIPQSVTGIVSGAFYGCDNLKDIHLSDIAAWCEIEIIGEGDDLYTFPYKQGYNLFHNDEEIKDLVIPDGVTRIAGCAFRSFTGLTSVTFPESVAYIDKGAFSRCAGLTSVNMTEGLKVLYPYAFDYCSSLTSITIPSNVYSIGDRAFYGCTHLVSVNIPNSVTYIGPRTFDGCNKIATLSWNSLLNPSVITQYCKSSLNNLELGDNVKAIENNAFEGFANLNSATIGNSVVSIGEMAFRNCIQLSSAILGNSVETIGKQAFSGCKKLTSITIPANVMNIEAGAFNQCSGLKQLISNAEIPPVCGSKVFNLVNKQNCILFVPNDSKSAYREADQWKDFLTIEDNSDVENAIKSVRDNHKNTIFYDLSGRRVQQPSSGLFIKNGKKLMIK